MNIAEFSIRKSVVTWLFTIVVVGGGIASYRNLSRLEDPEFTIKQATVMTPYPGASAREVEREISDIIEQAVQQMGQLDFVESRSTRGMSIVKVTIKDRYDKTRLPQVWDELRRKVTDAQGKLPPGAGPSVVNDDFGDVYGVFIAISGKGFSHKDLSDVADILKRDLLAAKDVKKIVTYGEQPEIITVEMNREKMATLGISRDDIYNALREKNLPSESGHVNLGPEYIALNPTGEFTSERQFGELLISAEGSDRVIALKDVAVIGRSYQDPPSTIMRVNGNPAVGIGISTVLGGNAIAMGDALKKRFAEILPQIPLGVKIDVISMQSDTAKAAVNGFVINLIEAVAIVVLVLLVTMGLRSGLIIGVVLLVTICGTFIFMDMWHVTLERISLGALIIALGMLVDNAIVVTDGMKVRMLQGKDAILAAKEVVGQTAIPLLGATVVAVLAFAAIGTSQDSTGEYCRTLFQVILISLMFSWLTAVTVTPLFCKLFLLGKKDRERAGSGTSADPYAGGLYRIYRKFLMFAIRFRWLTAAAMLIMLGGAILGFKRVDKSFFPPSSRPQYFVNLWLPKGTGIATTDATIRKAEDYLKSRPETTDIATLIGGGEVRFLLTYPTELPDRSYGQVIVGVDDFRKIDKVAPQIQKELDELLPGVLIEVKKFMLGPGDGGKIQLRVSGPDHDTVRRLAAKAEAVLVEDGNAKNIRSNWGNKVKTIRPQLEEAQARRLGIARPDVAEALFEAYDGKPVGVYRENNKLLRILARAPQSERESVDALNALGVWSPAVRTTVPLRQVVSGFKTEFEDEIIWRRDRRPTLTIHADPITGQPSALFARIKPKIEQAVGADFQMIADRDPGAEEITAATVPLSYKNAFPIKDMPGYSFGWDGEAEDSAKANANLAGNLPMFFLMMIAIVICLFNAVRVPLIIWLTVPFSLVGVTFGLLAFGQPFSFMAILGFLSLSGMLIKTAIVLTDEINAQLAAGKRPYDAVVDSGVSRLNPVFNASATTVLGMIPLFSDIFFVPMAVTIVFGLSFASVLILVAVPVFYMIFFRIHNPRTS